MSSLTVSKITISNDLNNSFDSIAHITSYKTELMSYFYLKRSSLSNITLESAKNIHCVEIKSFVTGNPVDISFVCVEDKEYISNEFYRFKILPGKDNIGLYEFPYLNNNDSRAVSSFNNKNNGLEYKILSVSVVFDFNGFVLNELYNVLFSNIVYTQTNILNNGQINKNVNKKRNNSFNNNLIFFKPLIKLENDETLDISFNIDNINTKSDNGGPPILELQNSNISWSSTDYSQNKFLVLKDLDIGSRKLQASISFKKGSTIDSFYKFNDDYYDISLNINGIKVMYQNLINYLINLNLDIKPQIEIEAFNNTGIPIKNLRITNSISDGSIEIENTTINIENNSSILDSSSSILDISKIKVSTIDRYKNDLYIIKNVKFHTSFIGSFNLNVYELLFNNSFVFDNKISVGKLSFNIENNLQNNNIIINTITDNGIFEPNFLKLNFNNNFERDIHFIPDNSKIVFDISEQVIFGDVSFNSPDLGGDLSFNIVKENVDQNSLEYDFKQVFINHIKKREDDEPMVNGKKQEMLGVKSLRIDISDSIVSTTNEQYLQADIEPNFFKINVIKLKTPQIYDLTINDDNKSVNLIINNDYLNVLNYSLNDINKGMLSFIISKYDKKNDSIETLELSGNDFTYNDNYITLKYDKNISVYDTLEFTLISRYNWVPENTTTKLYIDSQVSNKTTIFVCFNNKYQFGIYNTSSSNTRLYVPMSNNAECFRLSGNIYPTTTNQLTKSQVFSKLSKMRIKPR
tara:strand:+ start:244 stop:2484 length:2241 start_codon:yes stop_codon:yes gene_type:complete